MSNSASVPYQSLIDGPPGYPPSAPAEPQAGGPPTAEPIRLSFWADLMRSRPQRNATNAATCTFIAAGMSIAFSIGFSFNQTSIGNTDQMHICWFIGAIVGSLVGLAIVERLTKRFIYFVAIGLVMVNGICFTSAPENDSALIIGLYSAGAAFGVSLPAFIAAAAEVSFKRFRGMNLSTEHLGLVLGMLLEVFFTLTSKTRLEANRAHGIFVLIYVALSLISNLLCTVESPVYHLRKGNEAEAINCLHSLLRREIGSDEVNDLLAEHKQYLAEDATRETKTNFMLGLKIYPKIVVLFLLSAMSFSAPVVIGLLGTGVLDIIKDNSQFIYFFLFSRLVGAILGSYTLDTVGRRSLTAFSLFAGGVLLTVFGTMFSAQTLIVDDDKMQQAQVALIIFQLFAGIVATATTTYLGEAFGVSVKQYFVVASVWLECIIHIILISACGINSVQWFSCTIGIIQILFAGYFFLTTHETKETSLREALSELAKTGTIHLR